MRFAPLAIVVLGACNAIVGNSEGYLRAGDSDGGAVGDGDGGAQPGDDSGSANDGSSPTNDAGGASDSASAQDSQAPAWDGAPLDPKLSLPDPNGAACNDYGNLLACPTHDQTCRIASPDGGRCEPYNTNGATGYSCATSRDCDAFLECYGGVCTPFCDWSDGGGGNCYGRPCLFVGNTSVGVCAP